MAVIVLDGLRRMYYEEQDIFYYITLMNENYEMPILPMGSTEGICRGIYKLSSRDLGPKKPKVQLFGSGAILRESLRAQELLEKHFGVGSNVYSVTSYKSALLRRPRRATAGTACTRRAAAPALRVAGAGRRDGPGGGGVGLRQRRRAFDSRPWVMATLPSPFGRGAGGEGVVLRRARRRRFRPQRGPPGVAAVLRGRCREHRPGGAGRACAEWRVPDPEAAAAIKTLGSIRTSRIR